MNAKRKWIWLRGLVRWKVHWGNFLEEFQKTFPDDEILLLDPPGFGEFYQETCPKTMDELINHFDGRVDWDSGKYHILACSLGGMIAARWAERRPQQIEKMFLVNTSDRRSPFYRRFLPKNLWLLLSRIVYVDAFFIETGIIKVISNRPEIRERFLDQFVKEFLKTPFKRHSFLNQLHIASESLFPLQAPVPTVFINSTADRLVSHRCSEFIAHDWGSILETHKQAGHDLTLDDPKWVLKTIQKHL